MRFVRRWIRLSDRRNRASWLSREPGTRRLLPEPISTNLRAGLVNAVVPAAEIRSAVMSLASRIAEKSPIALRMAKDAIKSAARMNLREGLDRERDLFALTFSSEDKAEGVRAFLEKRKADFKGR